MNDNTTPTADTSFGGRAWEIAATALDVRVKMGLLTEDETAAILGLTSVGTLATWRSQKAGPPSVKLGKKVFYTVNGIGNWINEKAASQLRPAAHQDDQPAQAA